ncbi:guanylate kinase-like [Bolinopsis microptera]|uniref:guanylate kinase-like n=1 Tax=Bolinopsis microptera TaxID=2820187 RepID=UPI003079FABC
MLARKTMGAAACAPSKYLIVITGPSGCGKSTLLNKLFESYPERFGFSVSHTTRSPRQGEQDGVHYHFSQRSKMQQLIEDGAFLEHAEFGSNLYGTSKLAVTNVCDKGQICILDIELQGVLQVKKVGVEMSPVFVYIKPPSFSTLEQRLRDRNTENKDSLEKRLSQAKKDMEYIAQHPDLFNYTIVNDNLDTAYSELQTALKPFVESN